ncbi:MAG TPA: peroxiredoxin-like family protein [Pseudonocardia sp.]|jgi:peroxiredoxin|nr:peroxiredoxin-like family protein [Pseudonocardia sp.]
MSSGDARRSVGDVVADRKLETITGQQVELPGVTDLVHLQLRRFAGCPVCNLHLHSMAQRHAEIEAAGVRQIVVFHSSAADLRKYEADLPFATIADPDKHLYREFGVERSVRAVLHPGVWLTVVRAMSKSIWATVRGKAPLAPLAPRGGNFGLPADLLIAPDGRVVATHYGRHAYDQWSVDELLAEAVAARATG